MNVSKNKNKSIHQKFTDLFDNNWKSGRSMIRTRNDDDRSYDPSFSWDGRSDNPKQFTKLDSTALPIQHTRPVTLSGSAIISLDQNTGFEVLNVYQPAKVSNDLPLTYMQKEIGMASNLTSHIPFVKDAIDSKKVVVMDENALFRNNNIHPPKFSQSEAPKFLIDAGPNCDEILLNPMQRRQILEFEKKKSAADFHIKESISDREKLRKQIAGQQYKRGVLMYDSCNNEESEIYGDKAKRLHADVEYKAQIHLERRGYLSLKSSSMATNGNILAPETMLPRVKTDAFYQSKGGNAHCLSFEETHNRLFCRGAERAPASKRTQFIRNNDLSGKQHNFINHTVIEHWPSRSIDRREDKKLMHPSQTSLNQTRNWQGSIVTHDRLI